MLSFINIQYLYYTYLQSLCFSQYQILVILGLITIHHSFFNFPNHLSFFNNNVFLLLITRIHRFIT
ncbi:hypothetical protein NBO_546g0003 [Nosema bombycis CQ1]|uniref:Uncharacterized protein n=1 Tax=Nosema bombycis (strain CQ1 / CVCC 102059) TaxID=578461 RepID=R0M253_NOSB1|nr:hypothetical protein NBO_546g0003 [Nosema bombycis CQ1]|eukprot:EOB12114.1 hypothetical protein NBO_546g0003 [Nosema bombycis CQ1]